MKTQYIKINEYGTKHYYSDAAMKILHRLDGPAIELADGSKLWCVDGKRHRLDGPAIEYADGSKEWYVEGKRHRLDGPAVDLADGSKLWCVDGKRHRLDGPAVDWSNGDKLWYVDGKCLFEEDINRLTAKEIVLTMDEIAAKFGISVEQLKITK